MPAVYPAPPAVSAPPVVEGGAACATCGAPLAGPFCAQCGQRVRAGRLTMRGVATEAVQYVLSLDSGLLRTVVDLVRRPAGLITDVLAGRTVRYAGPVRYFLVMVAVAQVLSLVTGAVSGMASGFVSAVEDGGMWTVEQGKAVALIDRFWVLGFVGLVPFVVLWSRLLLRRSGLTLAEHSVVHLYLLGQVVLFFGLASVTEDLIGRIDGPAAYAAGLAFFTIPFVLYLWTSVGVFGRGRVWPPVATALALVLGLYTYGLVVVGVAFALTA